MGEGEKVADSRKTIDVEQGGGAAGREASSRC